MNQWKSCAVEPRNARATLLIPAALDSPTYELCRQYGGLRGLLSVLLRKYGKTARKICGRLDTRIATHYQSENLHLKRRHFRARGEEWAWARAVARSCGVSTCYFAVILIELELAGAPADLPGGGAPLNVFRVEHREWVNVGRAQLFRKGHLHNKGRRKVTRARRFDRQLW